VSSDTKNGKAGNVVGKKPPGCHLGDGGGSKREECKILEGWARPGKGREGGKKRLGIEGGRRGRN